ncbi:MAG: YabP/YqfC family sporulation protein [Clostridiales bacterium]|nr:YabP/YqfC family sporulation protein [Clostridiales bacterium]
MDKKKKRLTRGVIRLLDLPEELHPNTPRLTVYGRNDMLVENHMGILRYAANEAQLVTGAGTLRVTGEGLTLRLLGQEQVVISGALSSWEYE